MLVTGETQKLDLHCQYQHQKKKKSWMGVVMFEEWVRELDQKF